MPFTLNNAAFHTSVTPAYPVPPTPPPAWAAPHAVIHRVGRRSVTIQTRPTTSAAAAGLGNPWKKRLSTTPMLVLKRASRNAAPAT